jgi:hypothetical protein
VLLATNKFRGTNHWIVIGFFALCTSMYLLLAGDTTQLGNV